MINKAQEEMVGFALIMVIVGVILIVFLGFIFMGGEENYEKSYKTESFLQTALEYTTSCEDYMGHLSVNNLIKDCVDNSMDLCLDGKKRCDVLNKTLSGIIENSWQVGEDTYVKGYDLIIEKDGVAILSIKKGDVTGNNRGSQESLETGLDLYLNIYY